MRVRFTDKGADGIYPHEKMEVYAFGFRNQAGVAFGPQGTKWENALAVSDNGANDLGHRRIANGAEKTLPSPPRGRMPGSHKEGMNFVSNKRFGWQAYRGSKVDPALSAALSGRRTLCSQGAAVQVSVPH